MALLCRVWFFFRRQSNVFVLSEPSNFFHGSIHVHASGLRPAVHPLHQAMVSTLASLVEQNLKFRGASHLLSAPRSVVRFINGGPRYL